MRVLLGGVPFGCDNIGDEAILAGAIKIFRETCPWFEITVCTNDREGTARKHGVETCPAFGFTSDAPAEGLESVIAPFDLFVWCGATGLSDYPETTVKLIQIAQRHGVRTVLWNVGMNSEFNPAHYQLRPGKRMTVLKALGALTLNLWDAVAWEERRRVQRGRDRIAAALSSMDLLFTRDPESRAEVLACGVTREVVVGADSALVLDPVASEDLPLDGDTRARLATGRRKVGVCISAQRAITARGDLVGYLDRLVRELDVDVVFIPMNPVTDAELMAKLHEEMANPDRATLVSGLIEPEEVLGFIPQVDIIVASRLHLLILASIVHVPIVGIGRGSKVDNFLKPYGLKAMGNVEDCDFDALFRETARLLDDKEEFAARSRVVRANLLERLEGARQSFGKLCETLKK